jgi:TRAP-type transport system small permease protein
VAAFGVSFFNIFQRINRLIDWVLCQIVWAIFACMVILLSVQVVGRYVFGFSPVWVVESSQYSFVWLSFLGICIAYRRGAHISLQYLWEKAHPTMKSTITWIVHVCVFAIGWFIAYGGMVLIQVFGSTRSAGMDISMGWVYASLVVSGTLLCIFDIERGLIDLGFLSDSTAQLRTKSESLKRTSSL